MKTKRGYWEYQYRLGREYLVPLFREWNVRLFWGVLDVGCGEGGILNAINDCTAELGCIGFSAVGIDSNHSRIIDACLLSSQSGRIQFIPFDVLKYSPEKKIKFIILRDTLEHLQEKDRVMEKISELLAPGGKVFVSFPPFYSPFGGHQQMLGSFLRYVPWFPAFPTWWFFNWFIGKFDSNPEYLTEMNKIRDNRMSMAGFEKLCERSGFEIIRSRYYFSRPSFKLRYGIPVIRSRWLSRVPVLREFFTTGAFYLLEKK